MLEADAPVDELLDAGDEADFFTGPLGLTVADEGGASGRNASVQSDGAEWSATGIKGASLGARSGRQDTKFAWARTTSRLVEMTTGRAYRDAWRRRVV